MMKNNTFYIFIFSFILLAASCVLLWYTREQINKKIEIVQTYDIREKQNKDFAFGNQLKKNLEKLNFQEEVLKKSFLNSTETLDFITQIESTAQSLGLEVSVEKVENGTPEIIEQKYTLKPVTLSIQLKGDYSQIELYLDRISQFEKILLVKELKLYKEGETSTIYTARITIQGIILSYE